jgi:hypothetical protein
MEKENLAQEVDRQVNNFLDAIDPVGLPYKFYIILFIVGLVSSLASYILELNDAIDKERDVQPFPSPDKKGLQFRVYFNICNLKNRVLLGYTIMFCSSYISYGLGFNLAIVTGIAILSGLFNPSIILTLKNRVPVMIGYILDRIKVN